MDINNLYEKIINNKVYMDLKNYDLETVEYYDESNIFDDMTLKYIKYNKDDTIYNTDYNLKINKTINNKDDTIYNLLKINKTINNKDDTNYNLKIKKKTDKQHTYIENSFLSELTEITLLEMNEIKEKIKEYVNSSSSNDYLKSLARSYKKLRIDINNVLVTNIDNNGFTQFYHIICKVFQINIIIINNKTNIYNKFVIDINKDYYIFEEIINEKYKNYIFKENINDVSVLEYLKEYNEKLELNKIKQMKVADLRALAIRYNINSIKKKEDLLNDLSRFI
tara:strand:+ start:94 stop:933 length:840 start_codon:yes stop_codon:yes gene_type:complete